MKNIAALPFITLALAVLAAAMAPGCRENEPAASSAAAPSAQAPAADQGAPVPQGGDLEILLLSPSGPLGRLSQITAMFNQPMVPLGGYGEASEGFMVVSPALPGDLRWLNQYTLAFIPTEPIEGSLKVTAAVPAGIKGLSGAVLARGAEVEISLPLLQASDARLMNGQALDRPSALKPIWRLALNQRPVLDSLNGKTFFIYNDGPTPRKIPALLESEKTEPGPDSRGRYYYTFTAAEELPPDTPYQLVIEEGARSLSGPLLAERIVAAEGRTFGPLRPTLEESGREVEPEYGLYLQFSNPVPLSEAVRRLNIDNGYDLTALKARYRPEEGAGPRLDENAEDVSDYQSWLYIPGGFKAETKYTVTFDEGLIDVYGQELQAGAAASFTTGRYQRRVRLDEDMGLLETATDPKIPVVAVNIEKVRVEGYALTAEEAARFISASGFSRGYMTDEEAGEEFLKGLTPIVRELRPPNGAVDGPVVMPLDLKEMFGPHLTGRALLLRSVWPDGRDPKVRHSVFSLIQISDLGLAVKSGPESGLIWVTNLAEGRPWPGADLRLVGPDGSTRWRGRADESGLIRLPGLSELASEGEENGSLYAVAEAGGLMSIWGLGWDDGLEPWRWSLNYAQPQGRAGRVDWLLNALPLYKPGETARFKVIARLRGAGGLTDAAGENLRLEVRDPNNNLAAEAEAALSPFGTVSGQVEIPADGPLGHWSVRLGRADALEYVGGFTVAAYRAPAFEMKFGPLPPKAVAGERAEVSLAAAYHYGGPVSGRPVEYQVYASPAWDFSLPGLSDYSLTNTFGRDDDYGDSGQGYQEPGGAVASDTAALDDQGRLTVRLDLTPDPKWKPAPRTYSAFFTATDVDERTVGTRADFLVHPALVYAAIKGDSFLGRAGQPYRLEAVAADLDGNLLKGRKITATFYHRQWQNVRRRGPGGAFEYVSRLVDEKVGQAQTESGSQGVPLEFVPEKAGFYWALAEVRDDQGRLNQAAWGFYVSGDDPVGWPMENDDRLTLRPDKTEYRPGEVARIMVQSPFEKAEGLLTIEREGVREATRFTAENQTPVLEVPIGEEDGPNLFVSVILTRGRLADRPDDKGADLGKPAFRLGYTELKIPDSRDHLKVTVTPSRPQVGPGQEVEVAINVTDQKGQPFSAAEVAVIAADAAVIQLGGESGYFPDKQFQADQALMVMTVNNLQSLIGRRSWHLKGANPGGGGVMDAAMARSAGGVNGEEVRQAFAALAYFNPDIKLDENGRAKAVIKMPENLTTFKLYAVATGHGRLGGTGTGEVLVTRDLALRSALPNYAGAGDEFSAAVVVTNRGDQNGRATVTLQGTGFKLAEGETDQKTVAVEAGESREVSFRVQTQTAGEARFLFRAEMGEERDAAEYALSVIPPNKLTTQAAFFEVSEGEKRLSLAPGPADPRRGGLEVELSPTLAGLLAEPLAWLDAYPHGCIEQLTSRAWGDLIRLELRDRLPPISDEEAEAARRHISSHLGKLVRWQYGGGLPQWPGDYDWEGRSARLTAYALEFALEAKAAGFDIPMGFEDGARQFLSARLRGDAKWPQWYTEAGVRESKSYALAALSRAGANVAAYTEVEYQRREEMSLTELTNLIRAVAWQSKGAGRSERLRELLALLPKHLTLTAGEARFVNNTPGAPETWASPSARTAEVLETLCLSAPHNNLIPGLLRSLINETRGRGGHWGSTAANAAALKALAAYIRAEEPENPHLTVTARYGDITAAEADFTAYTDALVRGQIPMARLSEGGEAIITARGRGRAWASLRLRQAPLEPLLTAETSGGFALSRAFTIVKPAPERTGAETFRRGDIVRVTVTMMVPAPRYNVVLEDKVPAGFEPVNFNLGDADLTLGNLTDEDGPRGRLHWYNHHQIWPDRVAVYAAHLRPGVYTYSYLARAVTPGTFVTVGPTAEEMYAPETYGRGQGQTLTVEKD